MYYCGVLAIIPFFCLQVLYLLSISCADDDDDDDDDDDYHKGSVCAYCEFCEVCLNFNKSNQT